MLTLNVVEEVDTTNGTPLSSFLFSLESEKLAFLSADRHESLGTRTLKRSLRPPQMSKHAP